jgi:hypothetical protein
MKISDTKIRSLRQILNAKAKESDGVSITITGFKHGDEKGTKLIEKANVKNIGNINKLLTIDNFIRVKIELFDDNFSDTKAEKIYEYTDDTPSFSGFSGFGNPADLESRVSEMLDARVREMEYRRLQEENQNLKAHNSELIADLEDYEEANEDMKEKIKDSKSMKVYAELAGITLNR